MRVLCAMMKHETNSFSPVITDLDRFRSWGLYRNEEVIKAYTGTRMPLTAYIEQAQARGAKIITPVAAEAMPGGLVEIDTYETLAGWILEPIKQGGIDAIFLDLHGAMTTRHLDDGEGELLRRIREIAPATPIAVTLDLHANLTEEIVSNCDTLIGYKTYPHVDMYEVGNQIASVLWRQIDGEVKSTQSWGLSPVLAQTLRMGTSDEPMKSLQAKTVELEKDPRMLAVSVFGGFPMVDIPNAGAAVVVATDNDQALADQTRDELLAAIWDVHKELVYQHRALESTLQEAAKVKQFPTMLLDHADNVGSGGTADVMTVVRAVLNSDLDDVAVAAIYDPAAVKQMHTAGLGARLTLELGGKLDMPSIELSGEPLEVTGEVINISDGRWIVKGPMYTGVQVDTGPTAVFKTGNLRVVVTSIHHEPWDAGILSNNGIDPVACKYILLKSRIHYRAGFAQYEKNTFTLDGIGVTTSDNSVLRYAKLRRPIYPLDEISTT